jgi:apolipoprotein N-acyltransferase
VRPALAGLFSGFLLTLAFPPLAWWPLAWVALTPLYAVLAAPPAPGAPGAGGGRAVRTGLGAGFAFGLALFLVGMFWMTEIGDGWLMKAIPWLVLSLIQAGPFALLGAACSALLPRLPAAWARPVAFAALWTLLEAARGWGSYSFPWFFLAATQVRAPVLVQIVSVTGSWGLSFAVALAGALLGEAWMAHRHLKPFRRRAVPLVAFLAIPGALALGGQFAINAGAATEAGPSVPVGIAQGSFQKPRGAAYTTADRYEILRLYLDLSRQAASRAPGPLAFVAWPETVVPGDRGGLLRDAELRRTVGGLARDLGTPLLIGSTHVDEEGRLRNTAVLVEADGALGARYDKTRLVPVGEFFPLRRLLGPIYARYSVPGTDITPGALPGVLDVGGKNTRDGGAATAHEALPVGLLICYESAFPAIAAARVRDGARALVLLTSDQTFGATAGPYQHADLSVLRAVETRRYLVRAAATGISEVIDPWGRVRTSLGINARGALTDAIRPRRDRSGYVRGGDWFVGACGAFAAGALLSAALSGHRRRAGPATL